MKPTKIKILTLMLAISPSISANQLPENISNFFNNITSIEREKLTQCIQNEGLVGKEIINTSCEITDQLSKALITMNEYKNINIFNALGDERFINYKKIKSSKVAYPKYARENAIQGKQILSFTIEKDGTITNIVPTMGICGNPDGPPQSVKECGIFRAASKKALLRMKYKPASFNGVPITTHNVKHQFTFIMEGIDAPKKYYVKDGKVVIDTIDGVIINRLIRVQDLLNKKNFESAKSIAAENDKNHLLFKFLLGKIYMATGDTQMAINHFHQFLYSTSSSEYYIDKRFLIEAYGFLIELLYKNGSFNEIAKIEMDLSDNIKYTTNNYNTVFSLTYFYIGAALLNIGDLNNGLYYLIKSKRESSSENLKTLINQIIDRVENSL